MSLKSHVKPMLVEQTELSRKEREHQNAFFASFNPVTISI